MPFSRVNSASWRAIASPRHSPAASGRSSPASTRSARSARSSVPIMAPVFWWVAGWMPALATCSSDISPRRATRTWPSSSSMSRAMRLRSPSRTLSCWRTTRVSTVCVSASVPSATWRAFCSRQRRAARSRARSSRSMLRRSSRHRAPVAPSSQISAVTAEEGKALPGRPAPSAQAPTIIRPGAAAAVRTKADFMAILPTGYQNFPAHKLPLVAAAGVVGAQSPCRMAITTAARGGWPGGRQRGRRAVIMAG